MYYKMTNVDSPQYKELREFRENEIKIEVENKKTIQDIVKHDFDKFRGRQGQASFDRVTRWSGFLFKEPDKVDSNVWRTDPENKGGYLPNKRTKQGKEMAKQLESMPSSSLFTFIELLEIEMTGRFSYPFLFVCGDTLLFYIDDAFEPKGKDFIEITKKEFEETREKFPEKR